MHFMYSYPYLSIKQVHIMYYSSKKKKKMPFFSLFKQEQEVSGRGLTITTKPHVHAICNPNSLHTVLYCFLVNKPLLSCIFIQ